MAKKKVVKTVSFSMINERAGAIDIGSRSHFASIGIGEGCVREFSVYTDGLHEMAKWFQTNKVTTIAMESTGPYWKSPFLLLQDYGFEVILVNASHTKNVRGRKSDVQDCQWIWQLHSAGLLSASFQPNDFSEELRTYTRHRKSLIQGAGRFISKMQKALVLMNVHLPVVLSDITGRSGSNIIQAILNGERNPKTLASMCDKRVKASREEVERALTGHWKAHHIFELSQCWDMYQFHLTQMSVIDEKIDALLQAKTKETGQRELLYEPEKKSVITSINAVLK